MQDKSSAEMAVFPAEAPPCLPSTPSNSTDAAEYQNRTYPLPRGSKRQANSMSFIKLLTPMEQRTRDRLIVMSRDEKFTNNEKIIGLKESIENIRNEIN